jgi:sugar/nucleoside kinase (ribokinase family)
MADTKMDLVGVGHIVNETIFFPDRTLGPVLGSPPAYSLVAAARQGTRSGVVTKIGDDFPAELLATFDKAGVDTQGIINCGSSTCSHLIYDSDGNKEIKFPSRADLIHAEDIPTAYHNCRMMYVCTMQDDVPQESLAGVAALGKESAIDLGGYGGVHMSKQRRSEIADISAFGFDAAAHFDFVKASDEDCRSIFGPGDPTEFGRKLLVGRARASLITLGSKGALVTTAEGNWHVPPLDGKPIDATGGGDTFMGGFLSEYLRCGDILQAAIFGSATALCVIEKTGGVLPERMPTEAEARARIPADIRDKIAKA